MKLLFTDLKRVFVFHTNQRFVTITSVNRAHETCKEPDKLFYLKKQANIRDVDPKK